MATQSPETGPFVGGDQGAALLISGAESGCVIRIQTLRSSQLNPKVPQLSDLIFVRPDSVSDLRAQVMALSRFGDPVSRGPMPSTSSVA